MRKLVILLSIFTIFNLSAIANQPNKQFKVIKVIDGDTIYVDFNHDNIPQPDEKVRINGIDTFEVKSSKFLESQMNDYNLTQNESLGLGYLGKEFAKKHLLDKYVEVKYTGETKYCKMGRHLMSVYYPTSCSLKPKNGKTNNCYKNYEEEVLKSGFAMVYRNSNLASRLKKFENLEEIKKQAKNTHKLNLVVLNKKNEKYHKPNCEYGILASDTELVNKSLLTKVQKSGCCYEQKDNTPIIKIQEKKMMHSVEKNPILLYFVNPIGVHNPKNKCINNVCLSLVSLIDNAQTTIDMAVYGFYGQDAIINALRRAKARGVIIRGVVDDYGTVIYKDTNQMIKEFNLKTDVYVPIAQRPFDETFTRSQSALMHNKFIIIDNKYVWAGSTNLTDSCMTYNSNNAIIVNSSEIATIYTQEFEQMYNDEKYHVLKKVISNKSNLKLSANETITILFSPNDKAISKGIVPLVKNAKNSIYISIFYFTNYWITDELIKAHNRNVDIKIIADNTLQLEPKSQIKAIRDSGISLKIENWNGKMHQKSMVVDSLYTVIASTNWTGASEYANDENMLIIKSKKIASKQAKEFFRLWNSIPNQFLK